MAKKFKPVPLKDLKGDQKEKVQFILHDWKENPIVTNYHGRMEEWIEWFYGNQYSFYNKYSKSVEDISSKVDREIKNVYNRILPVTRQLWGEFCYPHKFYVEPNTYESEDVKASNLGTAAILYTNDNGDFQIKVNMAILWSLITGIIYWKEWWNTNLSGWIKNTKGKLVREPGDVDFSYVSPFNVRPDSLAKSDEDWRYFIEGKKVPKRGLEEKHDLKRGTLPGESINNMDSGLLERGDLKKPKEDTEIRLEYHEKKSEKNSEGRFMVVTRSGWMFHDGPNPSPERKIPYFKLPGIVPVLNEQFDDSAVRIMQPSQRQFNRYGSIIDENIQNYRMKCLVTKGTFPPGEFKRYTRSGIDFVIVNPGFKPTWEKPASLPEFTAVMLKFLEGEIGGSISVRRASMGEIPKYGQRPSGVFFQGLKQQDDIVLVPDLDALDKALTKPLKFRLQLIQKHYSTPRLIKTTGKDRETSFIFLEGTELRDNTDVRVKPGVALFADKQMLNQVVTELLRAGLIKDRDEALELLQPTTRGIEEFFESKFVDKRQAYRENDILKDPKKPYIEPNADDNNEIHYEVHNTQRKKEEFNLWPEEGRDRLLKHLERTKVLMAESVKRIQQAIKSQAGGLQTPGITGEVAPGEEAL